MNIERILAIFSGLAGLSAEEAVRCRFLCETAKEHLASRNRGGAHGDGSKWEFAAAALAYYRYVLWSLADAGGDVSVGEISVKNQRGRLDFAYRLCREAFAELGGALEDEGFVFERI